jgi:hypothetical protein
MIVAVVTLDVASTMQKGVCRFSRFFLLGLVDGSKLIVWRGGKTIKFSSHLHRK